MVSSEVPKLCTFEDIKKLRGSDREEYLRIRREWLERCRSDDRKGLRNLRFRVWYVSNRLRHSKYNHNTYRSRKPLMKLTCSQCGKIFKQKKTVHQKYCSKQCCILSARRRILEGKFGSSG